MRLLGHYYRRSINAVLAIGMLVMSFGVTISHSHAAGGQPHVHGFGWNAACPLAPEHRDEPGESHRHLILFGYELPDGAVPRDVTPSPSVTACPCVAGSECDLTADDADAPTPEEPSTVSPPANPPEHLAAEGFTPPLSPPLSCFALRAVAGVLRL
ncbi:hypothetical protein [Limnoglobus roseus]|uniref:Uncharacterized protein n=1 Tax=Limnoglobus roseus TaxID=2598579 RepID=A0A5C1A4N0_9BACT|nr:hypothetical protein [Limnoglobus roseus]QEL14069.1 hypothetical protein PX52LOC_00932 [Limnoglobus roseus]